MSDERLPQIGIGNPWWAFVEVVRTEAEAVRHALTLAANRAHSRLDSSRAGRFRLADPTFS